MSIGAGLLIICGGLLMTNNESFDDNDHHGSTYSHDEYLAVPDDSVFYMPLLQKEILRLKEKLHHLELTVKRMNSQLQAYCNNKKSVEVLPDFASETVGGSIVGIPDTESFHEPNVRISLFGIPIPLWNPNYRSPRTILQPWTEAGECWPFRGSQGNVIIELAQLALVDHVTLEHIPASASLTGSITSAPKEFRVLGEHQNEYLLLGSFIYHYNGPISQTFEITSLDIKKIPIKIVMLQIVSNWGNPTYTCIYRFRVHGRAYNQFDDQSSVNEN
ncbi:SUN domain-containing protein 1-like [Chelonus insularis]|uniref:SUN domain-containing protein 1-like n=1 Tax=Chelonus insularis TaxID=460826 RepID=UPI001589B9A7|nr:SUN domain-containing protein 1-like [Chelonus insularis]